MIQRVIERELSDAWTPTEVLGDVDDSDQLDEVTVEPVATHTGGTELFIQKIDDWWLASLSQPVSFDGATIEVITSSETFVDEQALAKFLNDSCAAIDSGEGVIDALAIVPHDGNIESVSVETIDASGWEHPPEFADVFAIFSEQLPDQIEQADVETEIQSIAELVYGLSDEVPDAMRTLNNTNESVGQATIQVFTVTGEDIELTE